MADFIGEKWKLPYTAQQLEGVVTNQVPRIGASGNWEVWDITTSAWVDTGVAADPQTAKLNVIGKGINLLDNWYFVGGGSQQGGGQFPINQRGLTSYTTTDYAIDRWVSSGITLNSGNIEAYANDGRFMLQRLSDTLKSAIEGKPLTFSALTTDGLISGSAVYQSTPAGNIAFYADANIQLYVDIVGEIAIYFFTNADKLLAVKLELGDTQTLARNIGTDANPNWVLNDPPPNFAQELAKCQDYQLAVLYSDVGCAGIGVVINSTFAQVFVPTPTTMRWHGHLDVSFKSLSLYDGNMTVAVSNIVVSALSHNGIIFNVTTASGLTAGNACKLFVDLGVSDAEMLIDGNL